jgi:cholesterol transport system auxiliary component
MNVVRRTVRVGITVAALAVSGLAGCALLYPAESEMMTAVLQKMPVELPRREPRPVTLLVFPPEAKRSYDTNQMAYTVRPYQVAYFSHHQWGDTPSQMLQPLLVRTLESTGYFTAVLTPPSTGRYTYALRTEILELAQDFTSKPAELRLSLRLRLSDDAGDRVVATKEISLREPMQEATPYAGVVAANDATAKALREVARFVLEKAD